MRDDRNSNSSRSLFPMAATAKPVSHRAYIVLTPPRRGPCGLCHRVWPGAMIDDVQIVEVDVIRAYWSLRSLMEIRWLAEHGYGAPATFPEVAVLNSLSASS